jgi:hypothetical protein
MEDYRRWVEGSRYPNLGSSPLLVSLAGIFRNNRLIVESDVLEHDVEVRRQLRGEVDFPLVRIYVLDWHCRLHELRVVPDLLSLPEVVWFNVRCEHCGRYVTSLVRSEYGFTCRLCYCLHGLSRGGTYMHSLGEGFRKMYYGLNIWRDTSFFNLFGYPYQLYMRYISSWFSRSRSRYGVEDWHRLWYKIRELEWWWGLMRRYGVLLVVPSSESLLWLFCDRRLCYVSSSLLEYDKGLRSVLDGLMSEVRGYIREFRRRIRAYELVLRGIGVDERIRFYRGELLLRYLWGMEWWLSHHGSKEALRRGRKSRMYGRVLTLERFDRLFQEGPVDS